MYRLNNFKHGMATTSYTKKRDVLSRFYDDMSNCEPCTVEQRKRTIMVAFYDGKYTSQYIMPIEYKMLFNDELKAFVNNLSYYFEHADLNEITEEIAKYDIAEWKNEGVELPEGITPDLLVYGIQEYL